VVGADHPDEKVDEDITEQLLNRLSYNNTDTRMVKVERGGLDLIQMRKKGALDGPPTTD
jgi:hypothetical protein